MIVKAFEGRINLKPPFKSVVGWKLNPSIVKESAAVYWSHNQLASTGK